MAGEDERETRELAGVGVEEGFRSSTDGATERASAAPIVDDNDNDSDSWTLGSFSATWTETAG